LEKLFVAFIDLEKAFDRVPREVIWWALRKKGTGSENSDGNVTGS